MLKRILEDLKKSRATILLTWAGATIVPLAAMQILGYRGPMQILASAVIGSLIGGSIAWMFGLHGSGWE